MSHPDFSDMLYGTSFDSHTPDEVVQSKLEPLRNWIKENVPHELYRFRRCSERNINALRNDEVWGSSIITFNDPFECVPKYDLAEIEDYINRTLTSENIHAVFSQLRQGNLTEKLDCFLPHEAVEATKQFSLPDDNRLDALINSAKAQVFTFIRNGCAKFDTDFYLGTKSIAYRSSLACFCEENTSTIMWGHYADGHRGFCLEYDFSKVVNDCSGTCDNTKKYSCPHLMLNYSIAPVTYSAERFNASAGFMSIITNYIAQIVIPNTQEYYFDPFIGTKILLTKSLDWSYEKEWRLFHLYGGADCKAHRLLAHLKPSAVYLGALISPDNRKQIIDICESKEMPCYQMIMNFASSNYTVYSLPVGSEEFRTAFEPSPVADTTQDTSSQEVTL